MHIIEDEMKKKIGLGTVSFVLFILALLWRINVNTLNNICLGDIILKSVNLPTWTNGNIHKHFTSFYSFIFVIPAISLGYKFSNHRFAKLGKIVYIIWVCMLTMTILFFIL